MVRFALKRVNTRKLGEGDRLAPAKATFIRPLHGALHYFLFAVILCPVLFRLKEATNKPNNLTAFCHKEVTSEDILTTNVPWGLSLDSSR
jgi:hypothetical protein